MIHPICTTQDGIEIYVELIGSEAARSIAKQPQLLGLVKEALAGKKLTSAEMHFEHNMGRIVGYDFIVDTPSDDAVFYACVFREKTYTRFIKGGKPLSTKYVAMSLKRRADGSAYELYDVRIGRLAPPRPGLPNETAKSRQYWATHAFVHDNQILQPRTVTKTCPY
jgi:hypothetical protein